MLAVLLGHLFEKCPGSPQLKHLLSLTAFGAFGAPFFYGALGVSHPVLKTKPDTHYI